MAVDDNATICAPSLGWLPLGRRSTSSHVDEDNIGKLGELSLNRLGRIKTHFKFDVNAERSVICIKFKYHALRRDVGNSQHVGNASECPWLRICPNIEDMNPAIRRVSRSWR